MKRSLLAATFLTATSPLALGQTASGTGAAIALPDVIIGPATPFNPYSGKFDGPIGVATDVAGTLKPIIETPRSVYVVTPQTLQQQLPQSLSDALQTVPGTFVGNTNGGNSDYITVKGFELDANDFNAIGNGDGILIDGIRAPYDRVFNANTSSIDLLSGPAALLYGNGNVGGVIDVHRKLPLPENHYAVDVIGGAVGGRFRSIAGAFDITGPLYKGTESVFAYRLVGSTSGAEPWRKGDTTTRDLLLAPTFALYSEKLNATLAYEHGRNQQPYDRGDVAFGQLTNPATGAYRPMMPLNISRYESYSEPFSQFDENVNWVHSQIDYKYDKDTDFHLRSSYAATDVFINEVRSDNATDFFPYGRTAGAPPLAPGSLLRYQQYTPSGVNGEQYFFSGTGVRRFDIGPIKNELIAGVDYYNFRQDEPDAQYIYYGYNQVFNLYNPNYGILYPNGGRGFTDFQKQGFNLPGVAAKQFYNGQPIENQKQRELGGFFQESATYGPFTLVGGGRYTEIFSYIRNLSLAPSSNSTEHAFLPSGQLLYLINQNTSLFASYSQAYQPNIFAVGLLPQGVTFAGPAVPQRGEGYEAGIKSKFFNDRVLAQATAFRIDKQHVQVFNGVNQISYSQSQRSEGAQFSIIGYVTPNLELNMNYSHQNVFVYSDIAPNNDVGNRVVNAPANTFAAFAYYHFLDGALNHLTLNAGVFGASANAVDAANTFTVPAFAIFSTGFAYDYQRTPLSPRYVLSFKANNIADTRYFPSTGSKVNWLTVGEPRNFLLGLSASL